jgi:nicotinamide-nucleotide amidase
LKVAVAESCSGGLLAALLTSIPGSSDVFERGFVTYSDEAKNQVLGVGTDLLLRFGAVSPQVALAMAEGALQRSNADLAAAVTGIAGPAGGTADKPVGLVYLAVAGRDREPAASRLMLMSLDRHGVRLRSAIEAVKLLVTQAAGGF